MQIIADEQEPFKALIMIEMSKEQWKKEYTLRARIGIRLASIIGLVNIKIN